MRKIILWGFIFFFSTIFYSCKRNHRLTQNVKPVTGLYMPANQVPGDMFNKILADMVFVQGGDFKMGCTDEEDTDCDDAEKPARDVTLSGFYLSKYHVTVREFEYFVNEAGYITTAEKQGFSCFGTDAHRIKTYGLNWRYGLNDSLLRDDQKDEPVLFVSWYDAIEFCRWLTIKSGHKFRLPTSAEYAFAARGGVKTRGYKYAGGDDLEEVAWYRKNSGGVMHPVGQKQPNELGLYDMAGLAYQWCSDWDWDGPPVLVKVNPKGPDKGTWHIIRGGAINRPAKFQRFSITHSREPGFNNANCGFRVARDL